LLKTQGHAEHLLDGFLGLRQKYALLRPMMYDAGLRLRRGAREREMGYATLRFALFRDCALDLMRLTIDEDRRTPSVRNLMEALSDPPVLAALRAKWGDCHKLPAQPGDDETRAQLDAIEAADRAQMEARFDKSWNLAKSKWDRFLNAPWLPVFRDLRDKHIAHLELHLVNGEYRPIDLAELNVTAGNLDEGMELLERLVVEIGLVARMTGFAMQGARSQFDNEAAAFWE
jgi:hypothetical protein